MEAVVVAEEGEWYDVTKRALKNENRENDR